MGSPFILTKFWLEYQDFTNHRTAVIDHKKYYRFVNGTKNCNESVISINSSS